MACYESHLNSVEAHTFYAKPRLEVKVFKSLRQIVVALLNGDRKEKTKFRQYPALKGHYPNSAYVVKQAIGVDADTLTVARTGIRGSNDLVWVGRAANYAANLCALPPEYSSRITSAVYDAMLASAKTSSDGRSMWDKVTWTPMNKMAIYRSNWT